MGRVSSRRLVGRDEEWTRLDEAARLAGDLVPGLVLVEGEAGIGKTRLVADWAARQRAEGALVATGRCVEISGEELPLAPVAAILRDLARQLGIDPLRDRAGRTWSALEPLVPEVGNAAPAWPTPAPRGWLFGGVASLFERLGREGPFVAVVEDLHWVDTSTSDLLGYLARHVADARVLLIATVRDETERDRGFSAFLAELLRLPTVEHLYLRRLGNEEVAMQAADILGKRLSGHLLERVVDLSDGVPFLVEEVLATQVRPGRDVADRTRQILAARLSGVSPAARTVVDAACLADAELTDVLLRRVLADSGIDIHAGLEAAIRSGVLVPAPERGGYRFRHSLQRTNVAGELLADERRGWHRRWAEAIEEEGDGLDTLLTKIAIARHLDGAGASERALRACLDAAESCRVGRAYPEYAALLQRALAIIDGAPDAAASVGVDRNRVVDDTYEALEGTIAWPQAEEFARGELMRAERRGVSRIREVVLRLRLHSAHEWLGTSGGPPADIEYMSKVARSASASRDKALALQWLSFFVYFADPARARDLHREAAAIARQIGDRRLELTVRADLANWKVVRGTAAEALPELCELLAHAQDVSPLRIGVMQGFLVAAYNDLGRFDEAVATARRLRRELGDVRATPSSWASIVTNLASALVFTGRWDEALAVIDEARGLELNLHYGGEMESQAGLITLWRGEQRLAEAIAEHASASDDLSLVSMWAKPFHLRVEIAAAGMDMTEVRSAFASLRHRLDLAYHDITILCALLAAARAEADAAGIARATHASADQLAGREAVALLREITSAVERSTPLSEALQAHLRAELARAEGKESPALWMAAIGSAPDLPYERARAQVRLAEIQCRDGRRDQGTTLLREAHHTATKLGAALLAKEIDALALRARLDLGDAAHEARTLPTRSFGLTEREREVLAVLAAGHTNAQIAERLFISPKTASVHVSRILTKLNATSRTQAAPKPQSSLTGSGSPDRADAHRTKGFDPC